MIWLNASKKEFLNGGMVMNSSIATEVMEEMNDLPDDLQQRVLEFVVTLRKQHIQAASSDQNIMVATHPHAFREGASFDLDAPPVWELAAQISAQVPDEEWHKLPTDLARRFDHYQKQRKGQD
jgi:hypothetical protein